MEIFGVGGMELLLFFLIMVVVAGPKRMIAWAYILGQYTAKLKSMMSELTNTVGKEMAEAGFDTRKTAPRSLNREMQKQFRAISKPITDLKSDVESATSDSLKV